MEERMRRIPTIQDVNSDLQVRARQTSIDVDRDTASRLGLRSTRSACCSTPRSARRQISTIYAPDDTYQVILEADPKYADTNDVLRKIMIRTPSRRAGAARHRGQAQRQADVAHGQPHRPAAGGHDLVQPGARRGAGRGGRATPGGGGARSACRPASPPASRAARRSSSRRSPTRACCCSPRCW